MLGDGDRLTFLKSPRDRHITIMVNDIEPSEDGFHLALGLGLDGHITHDGLVLGVTHQSASKNAGLSCSPS
jgi:hypothetical protein